MALTMAFEDAAGVTAQHYMLCFAQALACAVQNAGRWYFIDPTVQLKLGRNDSCPCASGQKFKKCCGAPVELH